MLTLLKACAGFSWRRGWGRQLHGGDAAEKGVVDFNGEIFGYPGLFVADGSTVPANLGGNPSLTITALSEYIMSQRPEK